MRLFKRDPFGNIIFLKKWIMQLVGLLSYKRYRGYNHLQIDGSDVIKSLPPNNVLFVSNHQTYYADVTAMLHVFNASLNGRRNSIKNPSYLKNLKLNIYYIAAKETMSAGLLSRILAYGGAISVERTWRRKGVDIKEKQDINPKDPQNIKKALNDGWVITFPQGTTRSFQPVRKGTAHIIKQYKPVVVPIVIDGFRRSFDKKGLRIKKKGILQSFTIKTPLKIDYDNDSVEEITRRIQFAIEQHPSFLKVIPPTEFELEKILNHRREW